KGDKKLLQGCWRTTSEVLNGKPLLEGRWERMFFVGDTVLITCPEDWTSKGTYQLDDTKKPKTIDVFFDGRMSAIYELNGDELRLCIGLEERPETFKSTSRKPRWILILKRDNSAEAEEALQRATADVEFKRSAFRSQNNLKS